MRAQEGQSALKNQTRSVEVVVPHPTRSKQAAQNQRAPCPTFLSRIGTGRRERRQGLNQVGCA